MRPEPATLALDGKPAPNGKAKPEPLDESPWHAKMRVYFECVGVPACEIEEYFARAPRRLMMNGARLH